MPEIIDEFWVDLDNKDDKGRPLVYDHAPRSGQFWERTPNVKHVVRQVEDDGKIYDVEENGTKRYVRTDPQYATSFRAENKDSAVSGSTTTPYILTRDAQGQLNQEPNPNYAPEDKTYTDKYGNRYELPPTGAEGGMRGEPAQPRIVYKDPSADIQAEQDQAELEYRRRLAANVGNRNLTPAELQLQELDVQKAQRALMNPYVLKQQQLMEAVSAVQEQIARGDITPEEGTNLINLTRQNLDASLRGTTPYQMEQDRKSREQTERQNRASAAGNFISNRGQLGGNLATGFLSGLGGIYGNILSGHGAPAFNPLEMATNYTNQMYGGPEMNDMALALLRGYLGQGGNNGPQ